MRIENYTDMIYACGRCNFCRGFDFDNRCPQLALQRWESSTGRGKMAIARGLLEGELEYTEDLIPRIFGCFMCGRCAEECKKAAQIDILAITKAMRADFVDEGIAIPEGGDNMAETALERGNIFADTAESHTEWAEGLEFTEDSGVLFFPGCLASHRFKEKTRILVRVLQASGYELDFLNDEKTCCGTPFWVTGKDARAEEWAENLMERLEEREVEEIITPCPSCFRAFDEVYPELLGLEEFPIKVRHTSEVLEEIVNENKLKLKNEINKSVTYHDPCEIGRYRDIYEPARNALKAIPGLELVEMSRNREEAFCCGGGGAIKIMDEDASNQIAVERLEDALETGAELLTTICPACELNLTHATYLEDVHMRVLDVAELLAVSAGLEDEEILDPYYFPED
ncbi:MAG: (Fe-S)-binding protein [Candidatus Thorarchaeota archaeon]